MEGTEMGVIVVGVDDSQAARAALRFAIEEARMRGASVHAVHAWQFRYPGAAGVEGAYAIPGFDLDSLRNTADAALEAIVAEISPDGDDVEVERVLVEGAAGAALLDQARDAELLVVGSRGRGGFAGLLLGSVSQQCAHHASCPVVIIPHQVER
jgi:nucleotide-binding universal stress UspA family protein